MSFSLRSAATSATVGLMLLVGALALPAAFDPQQPIDARPAAASNGHAAATKLALLGLTPALQSSDPATALDALADLLAARHQVRGHDTGIGVASARATSALVEALEDDTDPLSLYEAASAGQIQRLAASHGAGAPMPERAAPASDGLAHALASILTRYGATTDAASPQAWNALLTLPLETQQALANTIDAFLAFDDVNAQVNSAGDLRALILARDQLVATGHALDLAMAKSQPTTNNAPFAVAGIISIDVGPGPNVYTDEYRLLIDAGGDDVYYNNAGGSGLLVTPCHSLSGRTAAALFDLRGHDRYISERSCGTNGAGFNGAGLLYDAQGNDIYRGGSRGTNGGAIGFALGTLLDLGGNDRYTGGNTAVNGGAYDDAVGLLVDARGNDIYTAGSIGTNGGGALRALGTLVDGDGDDEYLAADRAVNGGGMTQGAGYLVDRLGNDHYTGTGKGSNGGAHQSGVGFLVDLAGADRYDATGPGTNGGASAAAVGVLFDFDGADMYTAGHEGVNGGGYAGGLGILIDVYGNDVYLATEKGVNGGATAGDSAEDGNVCFIAGLCTTPPVSWGLLLDANGEDHFTESSEVASGKDRSVFPKGRVGAQLDFVPQVET